MAKRPYTLADDFNDWCGEYYDAKTVCASRDEASKLMQKLAKRHDIPLKHMAIGSVSYGYSWNNSHWIDAAGWHIIYKRGGW